MVRACRAVHQRGGGGALWHDEQQSLVRVQLRVVALSYAAQLREVLRPLLPQQMGLSGTVAQQLTSGLRVRKRGVMT